LPKEEELLTSIERYHGSMWVTVYRGRAEVCHQGKFKRIYGSFSEETRDLLLRGEWIIEKGEALMRKVFLLLGEGIGEKTSPRGIPRGVPRGKEPQERGCRRKDWVSGRKVLRESTVRSPSATISVREFEGEN